MALLRHCLAQVRRKHSQSECDEGPLQLVSPPESLVFAWLREEPSASAMRRHAGFATTSDGRDRPTVDTHD